LEIRGNRFYTIARARARRTQDQCQRRLSGHHAHRAHRLYRCRAQRTGRSDTRCHTDHGRLPRGEDPPRPHRRARGRCPHRGLFGLGRIRLYHRRRPTSRRRHTNV
ncbi:uncharacterized protein METZ01_LOCUS283335, partial [marine metagenome]